MGAAVAAMTAHRIMRKPQPKPRPRTSVRAVDPKEHVFSLTRMQRECFPRDSFMHLGAGHWVMAFSGQIHPIGFCLMVPDLEEETAWIERVGVMPGHRGRRLQVRMLKRCEEEARKLNLERMVATTFDNPAACTNFTYAGWAQFEPEEPWAAVGTCYWMKYLR